MLGAGLKLVAGRQPGAVSATSTAGTDLLIMEVLQTKIWMAMPLRPLGSPAPHKVCSPYRQTQSTRSEQKAGKQGQRSFLPSLHPVAGSHLLSHFPHCYQPFSVWPFVK